MDHTRTGLEADRDQLKKWAVVRLFGLHTCTNAPDQRGEQTLVCFKWMCQVCVQRLRPPCDSTACNASFSSSNSSLQRCFSSTVVSEQLWLQHFSQRLDDHNALIVCLYRNPVIGQLLSCWTLGSFGLKRSSLSTP